MSEWVELLLTYDDIESNLYYDIANTIYSTAKNSSRKMDLGQLQRGQIEGPFGSIQIFTSDGFTYITFGDSTAKTETLTQKMENLGSKVEVILKKGS